MWCCRGPASKDANAVLVENGADNHSHPGHLLLGTRDNIPEAIGKPTMLSVAQKVGSAAATDTATVDFWNSMISGTVECVGSGAIAVTSAVRLRADATGDDIKEFFSSLQPATSPRVSQPIHAECGSTDTSATDSSVGDAEEPPADGEGIFGVDYQRYPLKGYVKLPAVLRPFIKLPYLDHYLLVGRPSMAPSVGLKGYKSVVPKRVRRRAPFLVVIDKPGMLGHWRDDRYSWVEFSLGDAFVLDVSGMKSMEDYRKTLTVKQRWNFKDRQKKFNNPGLICSEVVPVTPGDKQLVDALWPLYKQTGERNGFVVLTKRQFYDFHLDVPGLVVMVVKDVRDPASPKLVSFCTGVRWEDVLMPLWCGSDYANDLTRACSTYYNMLYNYVARAIADPGVNTVDLGASMRTAKTAIGFKPVPSAGYFRCRGVAMQALVETMLRRYYRPERLINDL